MQWEKEGIFFTAEPDVGRGQQRLRDSRPNVPRLPHSYAPVCGLHFYTKVLPLFSSARASPLAPPPTTPTKSKLLRESSLPPLRFFAALNSGERRRRRKRLCQELPPANFLLPLYIKYSPLHASPPSLRRAWTLLYTPSSFLLRHVLYSPYFTLF